MSVPNPLSAQFPLIARPNAPYTFAFAPDSFTSRSNGTALTYTAHGLPPWASFDSASFSITGTPSHSDTGSTSITISTSTSLSSTFTLLVSPSPPPTLTPLSSQFSPPSPSISSAFPLSPTSPFSPGLRIPPGWSFSLGLLPPASPPSAHPNEALYYAAPNLPEWVTFNNETLTFDGVVPSPYPAPYTLPIELLISDVWGFRALSTQFTLLLAADELTLSPGALPSPAQNLTAGQPFTLPLTALLSPLLTLDGAPLSASNISSLGTSLPSWLTYTPTPVPSLTGTPPSSFAGQTISLPLDITTPFPIPSVPLNLSLALFPSAFVPAPLPPIQVPADQQFMLNLNELLSNTTSETPVLSATFSPSEADQWLGFSAAPASLFGTPPEGLGYDSANVTLSALDPESGTTSLTTVQLLLAGQSSSSSSNPSSSNPSPPNIPIPVTLNSSPNSSGLSPSTRTALTAVGSTAAALLLLICLLALARKHWGTGAQEARIRKSMVGRAYVIEPEPKVKEEKEVDGYDFVSPGSSADLEKGKGGGGFASPAMSVTPMLHQSSLVKKGWGFGFGGLLGRAKSVRPRLSMRNISRPLPRTSMQHPGQGMRAPPGILIRTPSQTPSPGAEPTVRVVQRSEERASYESFGDVPLPPLPTPAYLSPDKLNRNPFHSHAQPQPQAQTPLVQSKSHTHMTPPQPTRSSTGGTNPFFAAVGMGMSQPTFGSSEFVSQSESGGTGGSGSGDGSRGGLGRRGTRGAKERPVRRKDFAAPTPTPVLRQQPQIQSTSIPSVIITSNSLHSSSDGEGEGEGEGESEDDGAEEAYEQAVISRAQTRVIKTGTPGQQGSRPRLVAFTSERSSSASTPTRLQSQKAHIHTHHTAAPTTTTTTTPTPTLSRPSRTGANLPAASHEALNAGLRYVSAAGSLDVGSAVMYDERERDERRSKAVSRASEWSTESY